MMKLLYLVVSLLFLGCSSLETEILESELEARAKEYILEFEFEQQLLSPKRGLAHITPLSIKGTIEFNDDKYFFKYKNYKSLQFDVVYTSTQVTDDSYNNQYQSKRDLYQPRVKILTDYHLTEDDLDFDFQYNSDPVKLDYSRELVGQIYNEDGGRLASDDAEASFILRSKKGSSNNMVVENVGPHLIRIQLPIRYSPFRDLPNFNDTLFDFYKETVKRNPLPEEDGEFLAMQISGSFFALKSLRRVDTAYSPYGNLKSKFMFDIKYDTILNFGGGISQQQLQNALQDLENLPTQTKESKKLISSLKSTKQIGSIGGGIGGIGGMGSIPVEAFKAFQLKGRIGFSQLNVIPTEGGQTLDLQYLDYFRFDVVINFGDENYEELILYSMGLSSISLSLVFGEGLDLTKEWIGQKSFQLSGEQNAEFYFFPTRGSDLIFIPTSSSSQIIVYSIIDEMIGTSNLRNKEKLEIELDMYGFVMSMVILRMVEFEVSSIKPYQSCVPKKINTKLTKYGEYQDCLFPQNKQMECYAYKALFPSGTVPTSCVVEECSSVDSVAFNRKCSKVNSKNICKIDSVKKQVCVKREACTGARKGDNCARVYQFLGENKKDTCVVESLPLASIVAPFNDASMLFKSNKYCH